MYFRRYITCEDVSVARNYDTHDDRPFSVNKVTTGETRAGGNIQPSSIHHGSATLATIDTQSSIFVENEDCVDEPARSIRTFCCFENGSYAGTHSHCECFGHIMANKRGPIIALYLPCMFGSPSRSKVKTLTQASKRSSSKKKHFF